MNVLSLDIGSAWSKGFLLEPTTHRIVKALAIPTLHENPTITVEFLLKKLQTASANTILISSSIDIPKLSVSQEMVVVTGEQIQQSTKRMFSERETLVLDLSHYLLSLSDRLEEINNYALVNASESFKNYVNTETILNHLGNRLEHPNYISASAFEYEIDKACFFIIVKDLIAYLLSTKTDPDHPDTASKVEQIVISGLFPINIKRLELLMILSDVLAGEWGIQIILDTSCSLRALANLSTDHHDVKGFLGNNTYFENIGALFCFENGRKVDLLVASDNKEIDLEVDPYTMVKLGEKISLTQKVGNLGRTLTSGSMGMIFDARPKPLDYHSLDGREQLKKWRSQLGSYAV